MKIGVIGAGECFREKMMPALNAMGGNEIKWIVDTRSEAETRGYLDGHVGDDFDYYNPPGHGFLEELPPGDVDVVISATPSRYHVHNLNLALRSGKTLI